MQVDTETLLKIIGMKEVEITVLRGAVGDLEKKLEGLQEKESRPLEKDPVK